MTFTKQEIALAKKYCNERGYLVLEEKEDHLVILDRIMNEKKLPYFVFKGG